MAVVHTLENSKIWFEDATAGAVYTTAIIAKDGDYCKITIDGVKNADVVEIKTDNKERYSGKWFATNQDGETALSFFVLQGLTADDLGDNESIEVQARIIPMLDTCLITGGSWDLGSVNTASVATNCGNMSYSTTRENGTASFNFVTAFDDKTQSELMDIFQFDYQRELFIAIEPPESLVRIGATIAITGYSWDLSDTYTGSVNLQLRSPTWAVYIPE